MHFAINFGFIWWKKPFNKTKRCVCVYIYIYIYIYLFWISGACSILFQTGILQNCNTKDLRVDTFNGWDYFDHTMEDAIGKPTTTTSLACVLFTCLFIIWGLVGSHPATAAYVNCDTCHCSVRSVSKHTFFSPFLIFCPWFTVAIFFSFVLLKTVPRGTCWYMRWH